MDFKIDHNNVKSAATSFTLTATEKAKYKGFAPSVAVAVSFDSGSQAFPLAAGQPMLFPENFTTIETDVSAKLYLGIKNVEVSLACRIFKIFCRVRLSSPSQHHLQYGHL